MKPEEILKYCLKNLKDTVLVDSWGEKGIFYNPNHVLKRGVYILTIKEKDGDNDNGSNLDRENVYRVNLGSMNYDFTELNKIIPHPVYAWMGWISVLNPSDKTFEKLKPFIQEAYEYAVEKFKKRKV